MADSVWGSSAAAPARARVSADRVRHSALVRATHWLTVAAFIALLLTGIEIVISHPRFYWGETGNVLTPTLFKIPIPASRQSVPTGYGYVMPDQNGWSRYLHFQSAWLLVLTGLVYAAWGLLSGHFKRDLTPDGNDLSAAAVRNAIIRREKDAWSYNVVQRLTYLAVIFVLTPLIVWTGLAMSPAFASVFPFAVSILGGQQSARTIHFFDTILLTLFLFVHVVMVFLAGFKSRMRAMITGRAPER